MQMMSRHLLARSLRCGLQGIERLGSALAAGPYEVPSKVVVEGCALALALRWPEEHWEDERS